MERGNFGKMSEDMTFKNYHSEMIFQNDLKIIE